MYMITIAFIGLGSNVGRLADSSSDLPNLVSESFSKRDLKVTAQSNLWRSKAWPDPSQPEYLNAVFAIETQMSATELMQALLEIEQSFGRERSVPNAPRTLDLDLIAYGDEAIEEPGLIVPHPRAADRRFVMGPLSQVAPDWVHPVLGKTALELFETATVGLDAHPV
ncbi:MAG: 2-amino-4-hydroxy-6-hydroxymethyldihydropteridine pyrophosphokinae [Pseudomonadota bacterium]